MFIHRASLTEELSFIRGGEGGGLCRIISVLSSFL